MAKQSRRRKKLQRSVAEASEANVHWREKPSSEETELALERVIDCERTLLPWLKPNWWRLRSMLRSCYDFKSHDIRPSWRQVLQRLQLEHAARYELRALLADAAEELGLDAECFEQMMRSHDGLPDWLRRQPDGLGELHAALLKLPDAAEIVTRLADANTLLERSLKQLTRISSNVESLNLDSLLQALSLMIQEPATVAGILNCLRELQTVPTAVATAVRSLPLALCEIEAAVSRRSLNDALRQEKLVNRFTGKTRQRHIDRLSKAYDRWLKLNAATVREGVRERFSESLRVCESPAAQLSSEQKIFKRRYNRGRRELEHEFGKQMRYKAIRDLVADETGDVVKQLKPVWLMSPLSVSDTLPLDSERFDVVIFDEASQITLEEAVPALFRAPQSIIVGDQMQLPPADFFAAKGSDEETDLLIESHGELVHYDLDTGSFLSHAAQSLSSAMLGWHYRSRSESLISFSNWRFYDGRLLTVPDESRTATVRTPIEASTAADGAAGGSETLTRPLSFHSLRQGVYQRRRNRAEAEYIAEMLRFLVCNEATPTIGIVAFSEAQQDEIEQAVSRMADEDGEFRDRLEAELQREDDGQFVGLLIKNLENLQGDERDVMILSVCYGHQADGKMRMNFGPINKSGGERRLNVAFSRAKKHMAVVCSIEPTDITNDYNDGANCLKNYLRYAQAVSTGDSRAARSILQGFAHGRRKLETGADVGVVAKQLTSALAERGYLVDLAVGQSHFRCDLAVFRKGDNLYRLGILIDNEAHYEQTDLLERDVMRPRLLRAFGWRTAHVLAKDWYTDASAVTKQLVEILEQ